MMTTHDEERVELLLDYLRELRALNDGGYIANKEIAEAVKEVRELFGFSVENKKTPLLTIELDTLKSVPKVIYKGEEIEGKASVEFGWKTRTDSYNGKCELLVHHYGISSQPMVIKEVR